MSCVEYVNAVIELFESGKATPEQWREMAEAIGEMSESYNCGCVALIDDSIIGPRCKCPGCGQTDARPPKCHSCEKAIPAIPPKAEGGER